MNPSSRVIRIFAAGFFALSGAAMLAAAPAALASNTTVLSTDNFDSQGCCTPATGSSTGELRGASGANLALVSSPDYSPNYSLSVEAATAPSYMYETYGGSYMNHTLSFELYVGSDISISSGGYISLARTQANSSATIGKVALILTTGGCDSGDTCLHIDYVDGTGTSQTLYASYPSLAPSSWHSITLSETTGTGNGSITLTADGQTIIAQTGLNMGSQPIGYYAIGDTYTAGGAGGHMYLDDIQSSTVTTTTTAPPSGTLLSDNFDSQSAGALQTGTSSTEFTSTTNQAYLRVENTVANSAPNALQLALNSGQQGSSDAIKGFQGSYFNVELDFSLDPGSDVAMPSNDYTNIARLLTGSQNTALNLVLAGGALHIDYFDSHASQHSVYASGKLSTGTWHSIKILETVGQGSGSVTLDVDGKSVTVSEVDDGSSGIDGFEIGQIGGSTDLAIAGHLYFDDVNFSTTDFASTPAGAIMSDSFDNEATGSVHTGQPAAEGFPQGASGSVGSSNLTVENSTFDSAPHALQVTTNGGGRAYVYANISPQTGPTLNFNIKLGSDFTMPSSEYMVLAQMTTGAANGAGKLNLIMAGGQLQIDYTDGTGVQRYLYGGGTIQSSNGWYSINLIEQISASNGAIDLVVNDASKIEASGLNLGTTPVNYAAMGEEYTGSDTGTQGHIYCDDMSVTAAAAQTPMVPNGFYARPLVTGLTLPTAMTYGPDGRLYIAELGGDIVATKGLGSPITTVATGFDNPLGLAWYNNTLYVSSLGEISTLTPNGSYTQFSSPNVIVNGIPTGDHQNDEIVFNQGWLYMGVGSTCDFCTETDTRSATIMRFYPDGSHAQIFATGLRNAFGLAVQPSTGQLYATDNGRNDQSDTVPDELNAIVSGGNYGWPNCWGTDGGSDCSGTIAPVVNFPPHCSADGFAFYNGTTFPSSYSGNAFVAEYGNEHDSLPTGHIVQDVHFPASGSPTLTTFATGFENPVDAIVAPDGSLLVEDIGSGVIWSIQANGH